MASKSSVSPRTGKSRPNSESGKLTNASVWSATVSFSRSPALDRNVRADVCIVGAGIAGLTTAYLLALEGQSVVVIDKNQVSCGETSHTSAQLSNEIDASYRRIERIHGEKGAQLVAKSHTAAIAQIEAIVEEEDIDCEFERLDGYLFLGHKDSDKTLNEELDAAKRAGINVKQFDHFPFDLQLGPCLQFRRQAQFHPLRYTAGLAKAIKRHGGRIFSETEAKEIKGGKTAEIKTKNRKKISAGSVVVATNTPVNDWVKIHTKQAAYRTYVIGVSIPTDSIPKALYWDTEEPFHYVRVLRIKNQNHTRDVLIVGGEDHKTGQTDIQDRFTRLTTWAQSHFPSIQEPEFRWSGQVMNSFDGLAFIGRNPEDEANVYIATGDSGMGLTHGTIAGMLIRDLMLVRNNSWATLYDPSRKSLRAALTFAEENLNVAAQYATWATPGEVNSVEEIKPGVGAILRRGLSKFASYRDDAGNLHERSAVCPHLGCIVSWNATERSWDCPCHGSRFDPYGKVLNGPAIGPLKTTKVVPQ
jgi:glycine/D-amino acid oxidase-like deaminating enzyme/nitrite reductase/ring-hydroxylating ferredoxin subunit